MKELLDWYKGEYEVLIADAKKLVGRQSESEKVVDGIVEGMRRELKRAMGKGI